jgi:hypothetical protein
MRLTLTLRTLDISMRVHGKLKTTYGLDAQALAGAANARRVTRGGVMSDQVEG